MQSSMMSPPSQPAKKQWGWIVAWIVVVIILILAALSYYGSIPPEEMSVTPEQQAEAQETAAIAEELGGLNVEGLDTELGDIEKELAQ